MSDLQTRAAELQSAGRVPLYGDGLTIVRPKLAKNLLLKLGPQPSGCFLYLLDLDNHTASQDAEAARRSLECALPHVAERIAWRPSRGHTRRPGLHGFFEAHKQLPTGRIYDAEGNHIGELIGGEQHTFDPGDLEIQTLTLTQIEHLLDFWTIQGGDVNGVRWSDRAKQGARWAKGYNRIRVTKAELRAFLTMQCGRVGITLDALFDEHTLFNRSDAAGNLMQTLMLWAHKLPGLRDAPYTVKCSTVMAYWMAAESYGKVGEKDYDAEKDGYSLIAQIVNQDALLSGKQWTCPFWAKSQAQAAPTPAPEPEAPRPAHRPVGARDKHLTTFRRVLEAIEPDDFGRRTYTLAYLAERMKIARCAVAPRTIQSYLFALRKSGEIVTAQIGGNGTPYAVLTRHFGGADNYQKRVETAPESPALGGADQIAEQGIETPQSAEIPPQCKEDHLNPSAPTAEPGGAACVPGYDWTNGGRLDLSGWRDPCEIRVPHEPIDRTPPPRRGRRQPRQKGQRTIEAELREPMVERQARERDARIERLAANVARAEAAGQHPVKRAERLAELRAQGDRVYRSDPLIPTPYRPRSALVTESLPEPPQAVAAPAGAQGLDAPLPGPQAGPTPAQRMAERQRLEAQRSQVQP